MCAARGILFSQHAVEPIVCICESEGTPDPRYIGTKPGNELKRIIAGWQKIFPWFNLKPTDSCNCDETATWMNRIGPDGCEQNLDLILDKLETEAKKRNLSIPFQRFWAKRMVKQAIRRARLSQGGK
jgi:hypothetical protein